ncbi:MAG: DUF7279 family protein [Lactococcus garvieae]
MKVKYCMYRQDEEVYQIYNTWANHGNSGAVSTLREGMWYLFIRCGWVAKDLNNSRNWKTHRFPVKPTKRQVRILVKKAKKDYVKNNALHILNELSKDLIAETMKELQEKLGK